MILSAIPVQEAVGQGTYGEKLNVFVAGNSALWYFTFSGVNGSSKLSTLESTPGLSWYNVTAVRTVGWTSDFQIFGAKGYGLFPAPFVPSEGMFFTVGSDSFAGASAAASALSSYLFTSFASLTNGSGTYSFYSPLSFNNLVPATLLKFLPSSGFANAITKAGLESTASPFVILEGQKSSGGFTHNLVVGSISASALDSTGRPTLLAYFGSSQSALQASTHSSSSVVQLRSLDGILRSTDSATVVSNSARFIGSYTLTLGEGKRVSRVNATVVELPDPLLATRSVDVGVLRTNDILAVTLNLRNLATTETITKVAFSDTWWNKTGVFKLLPKSNNTVPSGGISAGGSVTPVYRLQYTGTSPGSITIPASVVRYSYSVGGQTFNGTAVLNPIRLSLGIDDAVVYTTAVPSGGPAKSVGATESVNVTAVNVGTLPASAVFVAGHSISGLAAKSGSSLGGTATVTTSLSAAGLTGVNLTRAFSTTYENPGGSSLNASSNYVLVVFSQTSMKLGLPAVTVSAGLATLANHRTNLTLSIITSNAGPSNVTSFRAVDVLPAGLGCGTVSGKGVSVKGLSCSAGRLSITYPLINASSSLTAYMKYNLTTQLNYIMAPFGFSGLTSGLNLSGRSNPVAIPSGLVLSKHFSPSQLFGGMNANVFVTAVNAGPFQIFNATVVTTPDSFDSLSGASTLSKTSPSVAAGGNLTFTYGVTTFLVSGNLTGTVASAGFFFGGASFSVQGAGPTVNVYQPLGVSISTSPANPEEGKNFTINLKITNPTGVPVSNVLFTLPLPSGLGLSRLQNAQVSAGLLTVSAGSLAAHSAVTASASAVASSGITIPFQKAKLTFTYAGISINGVLPSKAGIAIGEDVTTRYLIPTGFVLLAVLAVAFYVRRKAATSAPSSPK
jgi:hypothetical protein